MIALLYSARPQLVDRLLRDLLRESEVTVIGTSRMPAAPLAAGVSFERLDVDRFTPDAARKLAGRFRAVAIPLSHANIQRYEYRNVEEFASALAPERIIRRYSHGYIEEGPCPTRDEVVDFHEMASAALNRRRAERIDELAEFTENTPAEVERRCMTAEEEGIAAWREASPSSPEAIVDFYRTHEFYLYQLTRSNFWCGGRTEYIDDAWRLLRRGMKVLEFGPGVGEVSLDIARRGGDVEVYDVNERLLEFIRFKGARRGVRIRAAAALASARYEAALAFDVLEHLPMPGTAAEELLSTLTGASIFMTRFPDEEEDVPLHFSGARSSVEKVLAARGFVRRETLTDMDAFSTKHES